MDSPESINYIMLVKKMNFCLYRVVSTIKFTGQMHKYASNQKMFPTIELCIKRHLPT